MNDRPNSPLRSGRSSRGVGHSGLTILIIAALLAGVGLAVAGLVTRGGGGDVVLEADDAVADVIPSTVPPRLDVKNQSGGAAGSGASPTHTNPNDTLSPLAQQLGPRLTAVAEIVAPQPRPVGLQMQSIDVSRFPVRPVGLEPDG